MKRNLNIPFVSLKGKPVIVKDENGNDRVFNVRPFKVVAQEGNQYTFEATFEPDVAGSFKSCVRMFPKNENLPHRQDFCYVKWLD